MQVAAFWFPFTEPWLAVVLAAAAIVALGLTGVVIVQLRRQVRAAWAQTGRIYQRCNTRFNAVGNLLAGVLIETDATGTLTYSNQAFHALTGFRQRDLRSGLTLSDLFEPAERQRLLEDLETVRDADAVRVRSYRLRRRDGAAVPITLRAVAITAGDRIEGWRVLLEPRPARAAPGPVDEEPGTAEQVLGDLLHAFSTTAPEDHEAVLARALAEIGRLLGADRSYHYRVSADGDSLVSLRQWYAPGVSPMSDDQRLPGLAQYPWTLAQLSDNGALLVSNVRHLDAREAPEAVRWCSEGITSLLMVPLRSGGEVVGVLGCETLGRVRHWGPRDRRLLETVAEICQHIHGDDQAARQLVQANERAADLAEFLAEPVAVTDPDGEIVVWNPALERLTGVSGNQTRGRAAPDVLEGILPGGGAWLQRQLQVRPVGGGPAMATNLVEVPVEGGATRWIQVSLRPLAESAGSLLLFCDVTATRLADQIAARSTERAWRAEA